MGDMKKCLCDEGYERCLCDGREAKNVYVIGEKLKKVYVMRDMKKCLCDEGYEKMFM